MKVQKTRAAQLADCALRLESLVRRTSTFVTEQLGQLNELGGQLADHARPQPATDHGNAQWTQQKATDQRRIEEQLDHLAQAWKELESEQRRLMMQERSDRPGVNEPSDPETTVHAEPPPTPTAPVPDRRSLDLIDAAAPADAAASALQFQKLKREIRQQSRRGR